MAVSIMTMIDFYNAVAQNAITDEVIAKANELIEKDAKDKEKAKQKRAEKKAANAENSDVNLEIIFNLLNDVPQTCPELATLLAANGGVRADEKEITPQYIATLMKKLVDGGRAVRTEIKGAKGKVKAYSIVSVA